MIPSRHIARFELTAGLAVAVVVDQLAERFALRREPPATRTTVYYDTFDWRLQRAGGSLSRSRPPAEPALAWTPFNGGPARRSATDVEPAFADSLPAGALREVVAPLLDVRRLLPLFELSERARDMAVLDEQEKTVARIVVLERSARLPEGDAWQEVPPCVRVEGVRGYEADFAEVVRLLESEPRLRRLAGPEVDRVLACLGRDAGSDPSALRIELDAGMTAGQAVREIFGALLAIMTANLEGACQGWDTEFVHDLRVAVRRTRSVMAQLKRVLARPVLEHYAAEFRWLGQVTGPVRDLDVMLLEYGPYTKGLPADTRRALRPLRGHVERQLAVEQARMVEALRSPRAGKLFREWAAELARPFDPAHEPPQAATPVRRAARKRIQKRFARVLEDGKAITESTPAEAIHALRIDGKKLRYLIEVFRSLYADDEVAHFVRALKRLQNTLGDFNDRTVHAEMLERFASATAAGAVDPAPMLLATGRLAAELDRQKAKLREQFFDRFREFATPENERRLLDMLKSQRTP